MKIIDEKGRLFGKINIIDFLVILFILCLTLCLFYGYRILKRPPKPITATKTITLEEYAELKRLEGKVKDFLREHKRAEKYFYKPPENQEQ